MTWPILYIDLEVGEVRFAEGKEANEIARRQGRKNSKAIIIPTYGRPQVWELRIIADTINRTLRWELMFQDERYEIIPIWKPYGCGFEVSNALGISSFFEHEHRRLFEPKLKRAARYDVYDSYAEAKCDAEILCSPALPREAIPQ